MNHGFYVCQVDTSAQLRYTQDGQTAIAEFMVRLPTYKDDAPVDRVLCQMWGEKAVQLAPKLVPGKEIAFTASIRIDTFDKAEGFKEKTAILRIKEISSLQSVFDQTSNLQSRTLSVSSPATPAQPAPVATAPAQPVAAPAAQPLAGAVAGGGEVTSYDDIPFSRFMDF